MNRLTWLLCLGFASAAFGSQPLFNCTGSLNTISASGNNQGIDVTIDGPPAAELLSSLGVSSAGSHLNLHLDASNCAIRPDDSLNCEYKDPNSEARLSYNGGTLDLTSVVIATLPDVSFARVNVALESKSGRSGNTLFFCVVQN